jgi:uncharacterized protein (DUF2252 family)
MTDNRTCRSPKDSDASSEPQDGTVRARLRAGQYRQVLRMAGKRYRSKLPEGPPVWICGDCHVGNLGPLADAKGRVLIQIRDLDQTVIGNPAHELVRLGLSLASAARGSDLPGVTTARILEELVAGSTTRSQPILRRTRTSRTELGLFRRRTRSSSLAE